MFADRPVSARALDRRNCFARRRCLLVLLMHFPYLKTLKSGKMAARIVRQ